MIGSLSGGPAYYRDAAVRGNTFQRQYQCRNADGAVSDLSGYQARWRGTYGDVSLEKTTEDGSLTLTTPINGTIGLVLVPAETRLIPVDANMKYELEVFNAATQQTILWGDLVGKGGVSHD